MGIPSSKSLSQKVTADTGVEADTDSSDTDSADELAVRRETRLYPVFDEEDLADVEVGDAETLIANDSSHSSSHNSADELAVRRGTMLWRDLVV